MPNAGNRLPIVRQLSRAGAIDPNNGEVLAFVSKPGYDPSLSSMHRHTKLDELNNSPDTPLNNRALRGQYPPGSTISLR